MYNTILYLSHNYVDCQYDTSCIEKELASPFSRGCSDDYHLNIQQPNSNKCLLVNKYTIHNVDTYCRSFIN